MWGAAPSDLGVLAFRGGDLLGTSIGDMCPDRPLEPVDGADAEANLPRHLANANALGQLRRARSSLPGSAPGRPSFVRTMPRLLSNLSSRASLSLMHVEASPDTLAFHRALEFGS